MKTIVILNNYHCIFLIKKTVGKVLIIQVFILISLYNNKYKLCQVLIFKI